MTRYALTLFFALAAWPLTAGEALAAPEPTVEDLVGQLETCQDLECPPIRALVKRGADIWPALKAGLTEQTEMTKFWTLGVLSEVAVPAARETLEGLLAHETLVRIRAAAAFALGNLRSPEVVPALAKALSDKDVNVRFEAASALSRSPGKDAVPALLTALRDKDEDVRAAVIEALAAAKDERAVGHLLRRAQGDSAPGVRGMAAIALANLGAKAAVEPLMKRLAEETNKQALAAVCWALGELGDARALAALAPLAEHGDTVVKQHATEAMAKLRGDGKPAPAEGKKEKPAPAEDKGGAPAKK